MLAFLALMPIRLRAFASLEIGRSVLLEAGGTVRIVLSPDLMKTGTWWESPLPAPIDELVLDYLHHVRPALLARNLTSCAYLWLNDGGRPYGRMHLSDRIRQLTAKHIGVPVSPQLFRDCAATTLTLTSPDAARLTRALLGHSNFRTAERHYVHASGVEAGRTYATIVDGLAPQELRMWKAPTRNSRRERTRARTDTPTGGELLLSIDGPDGT